MTIKIQPRGTSISPALLCLFTIVPVTLGIYDITPRTNLWVTWANKSGITDFCLALNTATDPFHTCLIGYPYLAFNDFRKFSRFNYTAEIASYNASSANYTCGRERPIEQHAALMAQLVNQLNVTLNNQPQELQLLGSLQPTQGSWTPLNQSYENNITCSNINAPVNGSGVIAFEDSFKRLLDSANRTQWYETYLNVTGQALWNVSNNIGSRDVNTTNLPKQLPPGYFLICGDQA